MLILSGPLPPPLNGQSVAFQFVVDECAHRGVAHCVVPYPGEGNRIGFTVGRALRFVRYFVKYMFALAKAPAGSSVYFLLGQTTRGFFRDAIVILMGALRGFRLIAHLQTGNYDMFVARQTGVSRRLIAWTLRHLGALVLLSNRLRYMFNFDSSVQSRVVVVPNTAPIAAEPLAFKTDITDSARPLRVLYLGNLIESKGYLVLLEAIRLLQRSGRIVHATYAGEFIASPDDRTVRSPSQAREMFFERIDRYGLREQIRYAGIVAGQAKLALLEAADVLVLPSAYFMEGQPVSILEAMSHGVAVIATDYRAIPDLVDHGITGLLIEHSRAEEVAAAIAMLDHDRHLLSRMQIEARKRFVQQFSPSVHATQLLGVIQGVRSA